MMIAATMENLSGPLPKQVCVFPASFAQERLWFLDQLAPGNPFYNLHGSIPLRVHLDPAVFERCLNEVVARHETLRTTFSLTRDGQVVQVIRSELWLAVPAIRLDHLPPSARVAEAQNAALHEAQEPFDLRNGPLIRAKILILGEQEHVLLLTLHHIVGDGWSMGILWKELVLLYTAFSQNQPSPLGGLAIQYADYATWQRKWMQGEIHSRQLAYWQQKLAALPALKLPTDLPRPAVLSYQGASHPLRFEVRTLAVLRQLSRRRGVTLFMTLLAAFQVLLRRFAQQDDIVVGTPVAGRSRPELEPLVGFFVNTVVMRSDLSGDPSFAELLGRVRKTALEAYANQDLPFEKLVEAMQPRRSLGQNPLFQVSFQLFSTPAGIESGAEAVGEATAERATSVFDLACNLVEGAETLSGTLDYSTELFKPASIARLSTHFVALVERILADPDARLSEIDRLSDPDRLIVLQRWNETRQPALISGRLPDVIAARATEAPDAIAVTDESGQYTYRELQRHAATVATRLVGAGVVRGGLVGVLLPRSIGLVAALLGVWKAGAAYLPLDPALPVERLLFMLQDAGADAVVALPPATKWLVNTGLPLVLLEQDEDVEEHGTKAIAVGTDDLAYVMYTSGSAGRPKGVEISHRGLENLVSWHLRTYGVGATDRATQVAGIAYDASAWELWPYLAAGASVHVASDLLRLSVTALAQWMVEKVITLSFLPTPLAQLFVEQRLPSQLSLRVLLTGGEKLHQGPTRPLPFEYANHYGPTEYTVVTTSAIVAAHAAVSEPSRASAHPPPIGRPIHNTQLYVLDSDLNPVPIGASGELYVAGVGLARGYRRRPALTAERFLPNPYSEVPGDRFYRTGDVVRYLPEGDLEYLGRGDQQVKVRGVRIELDEIEAALVGHPEVLQAAVALSPGSDQASCRVDAYLVKRDGSRLAAMDLRRYLQRFLPEAMVPSRFFAVPHLPLTPNGKTDRAALVAGALAEQLAPGDETAPRDALEEVLAEVWGEVLELDHVGVHQDFFADLGGHSLLATQLVSRLRELLALDVPLQQVFETPSVAAFAASLRADPAQALTVQAAVDALLAVEGMSDDDVASRLYPESRGQIEAES